VEVSDMAFTGELADLAKLQRKVEGELKSVMKIRSKVELVEKGSLPRTQGKSKKIVDLREI
jgi:phenylacetate-CoA ligase